MKQVDSNEVVHQRRLEEEVERSRLARSHRLRTGASGDFGLRKGDNCKSSSAIVSALFL